MKKYLPNEEIATNCYTIFSSEIAPCIQYGCKHAQISDLMKIGGTCHPVISEYPFKEYLS